MSVQMKKFMVLIIVAILVAAPSSKVFAMGDKPTPEQQARLKEVMDQMNAEKCPEDSKAIVEIDGVEFAVRAMGLEIRMKPVDQRQPIDAARVPKGRCVQYYPNVQWFRIGMQGHYFSVGFGDGTKERYQQILPYLEAAEKENRVNISDSGIKHFIYAVTEEEYFIYPDKITDKDDVFPKIVSCMQIKDSRPPRMARCGLLYKQSNNLNIAYSFSRGFYLENNFTDAFKYADEVVNGMINDAKKIRGEQGR